MKLRLSLQKSHNLQPSKKVQLPLEGNIPTKDGPEKSLTRAGHVISRPRRKKEVFLIDQKNQ